MEDEQREQMEIVFKVAVGIWLVGLSIGAFAQSQEITDLRESVDQLEAGADTM